MLSQTAVMILMGWCKKDVTPLLTHWSYVFLALTHPWGKIAMQSHLVLLSKSIYPIASCWAPTAAVAHLVLSWKHYDIDMIPTLLALCEGNLPVTSGSPSKRPLILSLLLPWTCPWTNIWMTSRSRCHNLTWMCMWMDLLVQKHVKTYSIHFLSTIMVKWKFLN